MEIWSYKTLKYKRLRNLVNKTMYILIIDAEGKLQEQEKNHKKKVRRKD